MFNDFLTLRKAKGLFLLGLLLFCCCCSEKRQTAVVYFSNPDGSSSPKITAELALTPSQRLVGLMYRKKFADDAGMLFIYPQESMQSFWMKNTAIALDIIFMNKEFTVHKIVANTVPYSEKGIPSEKPAMHVLEVRAGKAQAWGIVEGSVLRVDSTLPKAE